MKATTSQSRWVPGLVVALAAVAAGLFVMTRFPVGDLLGSPPAPIQSLVFERVTFEPGRVIATVRNDGQDPIEIAQVLVDEAYWQFTADPGTRLERLDSTRLDIPFPWDAGDPMTITLVDSTGLTFEHEIEVVAETPQPGAKAAAGFALLGVYAGLVPVLLGLLFLPALRRLPERGLRFLLGLTAGLLLFLALDAMVESLELSEALAAPFQGTAVVFGAAAASFGVLAGIGRWLRRRRAEGPSGLQLAYLVAVGIGLHNLGEGLSIGSAQAIGAVALGTFLVIGFAIHNLTEGIGIVAPTVRTPPGLGHLLALGAIAGLPTIAGTLVGGFAFSPLLATVFLAVGIGAILQVVWELWGLARRTAVGASWAGGLAAGFAVMYATGFLVK